MARPRLLFLTHRIPYPPNKGDKIRAWHMLDHLAGDWDVDLGCLVDDVADLAHVPMLRERCATVQYALAIGRGRYLRALGGMRPGRPLSLAWFHDEVLAGWTRSRISEGRYKAVLAFSSAMAPYALGPSPAGTRRVLDMVDVDSEKWRAYAAGAGAPMRPVWAREARTLLAFERRAAVTFDRTLLVTRGEAARLAELVPEAADRIGWVENGVDLDHFDPGASYEQVIDAPGPAIVFTGRMDYRPNIEAVRFFARDVLPRLRGRIPDAVFVIVGAAPTAEVRSLAGQPGVIVTGTVADTRPYMAAAVACVAPLTIGRGIQNKVLEAMAMARPVVCSPAAFDGVRAEPGRDLLLATTVDDWVTHIGAIVDGAHPTLGQRARAAVTAGHVWSHTLRALNDALVAPETVRS